MANLIWQDGLVHALRQHHESLRQERTLYQKQRRVDHRLHFEVSDLERA